MSTPSGHVETSMFNQAVRGALCGALILATHAVAKQPDAMIPRTVLFGNPDKAAVRLSPDGAMISYLQPTDGVLNVWVAPVDQPLKAKAVTNDNNRGIRRYQWAFDSRHVIYLQDVGGDEDWKVYSVDVVTGQERCLTPYDKIAANIQHASSEYPSEILVAINNRNPRLHDIHRVNVANGQSELVVENPGFLGFITDDQFRVRLALQFQPDGSLQILTPATDGQWRPAENIPQTDSMTTSPVGFDHSGEILYFIDSRERETAALVQIDPDTGDKRVLFENPRADVSNLIVHPTTGRVQAVASNYAREQWTVLDDDIRDDIDFIRSRTRGDFQITSRTLDDSAWLVALTRDDGPVEYFLYAPDDHALTYLFSNRKALEGQPLTRMHDVVIQARDGLELVSYLSLPRWLDSDGDGRPAEPIPMVLLVHGGPWARDQWGFDTMHQLLANRGYAVLAVNYRGSTGFGKSFINKADGEWAGRMHDDLLDAVSWAVRERIADPQRVAIMGGSYGGYATLVGLTMTPDVFACGVDIVGPSSLLTLMENIPEYWYPFLPQLTTRVGDPSTEEGRAALLKRSPLTYADRITKPLLIGQGANDPRVKQVESDQIVKAMQANDIPVTYVLYPDEGHGFARPENNLSFFAVAEAFLATHLGGRYQPFGDDLDGSSIQVPAGAGLVPGLAEALEGR
jgi:dipeptidyl aminopeptidase/acylaminoacyl peptidase